MSMKDKLRGNAAMLANLPAARRPEAPASARPVTAPGAAMLMQPTIDALNQRTKQAEADAAQFKDQLDEAQQALQQWDGAKAARLLDPTHIRASRWANRHELNFSTAEFEALKAEIANAGGNVQPIKVRPVSSADGVQRYEVIYGHRRHRACLELGLPVLSLVDAIDDAALFIEMERENRGRQDLSAWEQGVMYRRALELGLFPSMRNMAAALGMEHGNISKAIALASLPDDLVQSFPSPLELQFRWLAPLKEALERDPEAVLARARDLRARVPRLPAKEVLAKLTTAEAPASPFPVHEFRLRGKVVGSWERDARGGVTLRLKPGILPPEGEKQVLEVLARFFD